jgi:hypothetical protein
MGAMCRFFLKLFKCQTNDALKVATQVHTVGGEQLFIGLDEDNFQIGMVISVDDVEVEVKLSPDQALSVMRTIDEYLKMM